MIQSSKKKHVLTNHQKEVLKERRFVNIRRIVCVCVCVFVCAHTCTHSFHKI